MNDQYTHAYARTGFKLRLARGKGEIISASYFPASLARRQVNEIQHMKNTTSFNISSRQIAAFVAIK